MIPRPLNEVSLEDISALISVSRVEDQRIEYKREFPGVGQDRSPTYKTICAFANTDGGDLLIGIEALDGVPVAVTGVEIANVDAFLLGLSQSIAECAEPPLREVQIRVVEIESARYVVLIRCGPSWARPHRLKRGNEFYARSTAGNYQMDLHSVKRQVLQMDAIGEHARSFHVDRIATLLERNGPVRLVDGALLLMHLAPMSAISDRSWRIGPEQWRARWLEFQPPGSHGTLGWKYHTDGFVAHAVVNAEFSRAYSLMFREGVLEVACVVGGRANRVVSAAGVESLLVSGLTSYLPLLQSFGLGAPFMVVFSLLFATGNRLDTGDVFQDDARPFDRAVLKFPWRIIHDLSEDPADIVRPNLDALWNAAGLERSINYTEQARERRR